MNSTLNSSGNSSVGSQVDYDDNALAETKNLIKEALKSRLFLGRYVERRLVNEHVGYRDIVVVSPAETELIRDLTDAVTRLRPFCNNIHWIGITEPEILSYKSNGLCLWTEIDNEPFGAFWFQIRTIQFRADEIIVKIKCIRHITDAFLEAEPILTGAKAATKTEEDKTKTIQNSIESLNMTYNEISNTLKTALTITNVKEFFTFIFALVIALFTGSTAFVSFLGNFILALVRETSVLIKNSTPLFLGFMDFMSKVVGGFYILLAMFFKPAPLPPSNRRSLKYPDTPYHDDMQVDSRYID